MKKTEAHRTSCPEQTISKPQRTFREWKLIKPLFSLLGLGKQGDTSPVSRTPECETCATSTIMNPEGEISASNRSTDSTILSLPVPLRNKNLLLLNNTKSGVSIVFSQLSEMLGKDANSVSEIKSSREMDGNQFGEARKYDLVICGIGDCGSCSMWLITNALKLRAVGIPVVAVVTEPFREFAEYLCRVRGYAIPIVTVNTNGYIGQLSSLEMRNTTDTILRGLNSEAVSQLSSTATSKIRELPLGEDPEELFDFFDSCKLSDGLPVIPPTVSRVEKMLKFTDRDPEEILIPNLGPSASPLTIRKLAINSIMAGAKPEYFPVLITIFECMREQKYNLNGASVTTNPAVHMILISGPIAQELGVNGGLGCFGPGWRANSTIGRAVNLTLINVGHATPGVFTRSTFQHPGRYSFCFSENTINYPTGWPKINEENRLPNYTTVTCFVCEGPIGVKVAIKHSPDQILSELGREITNPTSNNAASTSELFLFLGPMHAELIARAGWSKEDIRNHIFKTVRNPVSEVRANFGDKFDHGASRSRILELANEQGLIPCVLDPKDIHIGVAGGPGVWSQVIRPWGSSFSVTKPIIDRAGKPIVSIDEFFGAHRTE